MLKDYNTKVIAILLGALVLVISIWWLINREEVAGVRDRQLLEEEPVIVVEQLTGEQEELRLEEYVTGVVAGEMKANWPENAYAAQAIIARTFALKYMSENQTNVISGSFEYAQEYKPENITENVRKAVEKTRGEVIVYNDEYINAWFHASAGGQTSLAQVGLAFEKEEPPYIKSIKSPDQEAPADVQNWTVAFSDQEIIEALVAMGNNIGELREIKIVDRDNAGRIIELEFIGTQEDVTVKAANFRTEIGSQELKSTKIEAIEKENGGYSFTGTGFGHGVGMSQWGAFVLAQQGKTPEDIIRYYFNQIEIVKDYN